MESGPFDLLDAWGELLMAFFLILGVVIAVSIHSFALSLAVMFLSGLLFGRLWYRQRKSLRVGLALATIGIILGFLLGKFFGHTQVVVIIFAVGAFVSYYIHYKGWISSVEY